MLGQYVAQHVTQTTEHRQQSLIALSHLGAGTQEQTNACRIIMQRLTAFHILGQYAMWQEKEEEESVSI